MFYEGYTKEWILNGSRDSANAVYSPQPGDDDIGPPNGEWSSHNGKDSCNVKASDEPKIPPDILGILNNDDENALYEGVDKAATPAERLQSTAALQRDLERQRPLCLMAQRDSDANKEVKKAVKKHGDISQK